MANPKEANARVKINKLLEKAGWRFFDDKERQANIRLESMARITQEKIDSFGEDFEKTKKGFIDYLLLGKEGRSIAVLEAKRETKNPLDGKEQARSYARGENVRFIILSNGNGHYFWDLERGNPEVITEFPTQESLIHHSSFKPENKRLVDEEVNDDYIALTQNSNFKEDPNYQDETKRAKYLKGKNLRILRPYQLKSIHALQKSAKDEKDRFLFEMATGTGKTLVSAAIAKLFLRTRNAKRILFLVDRLELENQAYKSFEQYLSKDFNSVIYKQNRDNWKNAQIVISTVQSLVKRNKYRELFSPTDFDLVISDEAHRSINGNSRAVFEYFIGYKLGLTATPKDYLKNINSQELSEKDPRGWERRQLLDTYKTFGCSNEDPTFRYSLPKGVQDGYLINPFVIDVQTGVTTKLLSEKGYAIMKENEDGEKQEGAFFPKDFEKKFFSEDTNRIFCEAFLKKALIDPISKEVGRSIIFCARQAHASKITNMLNKLAMEFWPGKYKSDFALQVTSNIPDAQQFAVRFANNNLNGHTNFLENYKSSKTRVCVTVGMMTTGYDCQDILNLALMRPIFSPTDFVQIKGRGTRKYLFEYTDELKNKHRKEKTKFKLFDFFANCEYFEKKFKYDDVLKLPSQQSKNSDKVDAYIPNIDTHENLNPDSLAQITETQVGEEGMRVDREFFGKACEQIRGDARIEQAVQKEQWDDAVKIVREEHENKPELYINLEKIRKNKNLDRRLGWREFLEHVFGLIDRFKSKDELLEEECAKFISIYKPESKYIPLIEDFFETYIRNDEFRRAVNDPEEDIRHFPEFPHEGFKELDCWREKIPTYITDNVPLNTYMT